MAKQPTAATESTTLLAAVQSATAADLDTVRNRIDELKKELDALNAVEKVIDIRINGKQKRATPATAGKKSALAEKVFDDIVKNGPGTVGTIAKRTGLAANRIAMCASHSAWFTKDQYGLISIAKAN